MIGIPRLYPRNYELRQLSHIINGNLVVALQI
jgi:hypothetical protein